ncbi:MAG: hypothetical protein ACW99J_19210 [Candidatus Thorarchaeota archaeon]|jgi:hypothetical protein
MIDTNPTSKIIRDAAGILERAAVQLRIKANQLDDTRDFSLVSEAMNDITNAFSSIRLDLFITRPIRELERHNG